MDASTVLDRSTDDVRAADPGRGHPEAGEGAGPRRGRLDRLRRGHPDDPRWVRPALLGLLLATGVLYVWGLSASGNANSYYAAAVQAGSQSWKAWFFGAIDQAASITVDKPPASLWVMGLSARLFGYSSWSMLVPQAIEGVAAVGLLYATVRRVGGPAAGLMAGALLALTPAAVLIFRFNNPDALLVLLVVAATYAMTRALESGRTRWLVWAGVALGFGFLTKSGQALLVVPALSVAYLVAAPTSLGRRLVQLVLALVALVVSAGWWIAAVSLWPTSSRPYIGGSTDNNPLELAFGYNGLGRLFGGAGNGGGGGGGGGNTGFGGATGVLRMFRGEFALEIAWLLPAALVALGALVWLTLRARRTDRLRAAVVVWGGSLVTTALVFSFMQGTIHPYYSVALAPSIAALVALAARELWVRNTLATNGVLGVMVSASAAYGATLMRSNDASTLLVLAIAAAGLVGALAVVLRSAGGSGVRRALPAIALVAALAVTLPTAAWGAQTAASTHTGSIPTAVSTGGSGSGPGAMGGGGGDQGTSSALVSALTSSTTTWSAATIGAQSAASLELSSNTSVMAIGGFSGSDDAPTLAQFKAYVASGSIHYFVASGGGQGGGPGGQGGSGSASEITAWVQATYTATTIGGTTVYDLTSAS